MFQVTYKWTKSLSEVYYVTYWSKLSDVLKLTEWITEVDQDVSDLLKWKFTKILSKEKNDSECCLTKTLSNQSISPEIFPTSRMNCVSETYLQPCDISILTLRRVYFCFFIKILRLKNVDWFYFLPEIKRGTNPNISKKSPLYFRCWGVVITFPTKSW